LQPVHLFSLAARQAEWASVRQALITGNIANANTPGFAAREIKPFQDVLDSTRLEMARTARGHVDVSGASLDAAKAGKAESWDITYSGNSVSIDQELVKADEVSRSFSLNAGVVRAFHRMILASARIGA
jgi:flagellar basal-body rod protein FlgB